MWLYDFHICYLAGQAVLAGESPNLVPGFISPFPLAALFALIAWLPEPVAYGIYLACCLGLMWAVFKPRRNIVWALLSFPVFFNLFVGQVDLPLALLGTLLGPWALPFLLAKPHLAFVVAPWIIRHSTPRQLMGAALGCLAFLGLCFLLRPAWVSEWLFIAPTLNEYSQRDSNLYWLVPETYKTFVVAIAAVTALGIGFLAEESLASRTILHLFAPLTNIYSASALAQWFSPIEMLLSWVAILAVGGKIHNGAPMFLIGCSILIRYYIQHRRAQRISVDAKIS
jgi:hypothetical protein